MADPRQLLEIEIVRALRCIDRAAMLASALETHAEDSDKWLQASVRRVKAIREALLAAGIRLPPLRVLGQTDSRYGLGGEREDALR